MYLYVDNGVRRVNFATSKNLVVKRTMFPHQNIHKMGGSCGAYGGGKSGAQGVGGEARGKEAVGETQT
jgi:hypothetical protein